MGCGIDVYQDTKGLAGSIKLGNSLAVSGKIAHWTTRRAGRLFTRVSGPWVRRRAT